jgi:hypothetical protein
MAGPARQVRSGVGRAVATFVIAAVLLCVGAGVLFVVLDQQSRSSTSPAGTFASEVSDRCRFVRTSGGVRAVRLLPAAGIAEPAPEAVLGSAQYYVYHDARGSPHPTSVRFTIRVWDVSSVHGPPETDARAWRAIAAEAVQDLGTLGFEGYRVHVPRGALKGDEDSKGTYPFAYVQNVAVRLWQAPLLLGACLLLALARAVAPTVIGWVRSKRRAARHMRCASCGYELRGLAHPKCPECGAVLSAEQRKNLEVVPPKAA